MIALTYMSIADVFVLVEEDGHDTGVYISECCTVYCRVEEGSEESGMS